MVPVAGDAQKQEFAYVLVQASLPQRIRRASVVLDLLSTACKSVHLCAAMHLLLCLAADQHAAEHSLL